MSFKMPESIFDELRTQVADLISDSLDELTGSELVMIRRNTEKFLLTIIDVVEEEDEEEDEDEEDTE